MKPSELIAQGKIKRYFRSRRKFSAPSLISHITQRASGKEPLFLEEADYLYMLKLLKETSQEFRLRLFAFVLMTNHLHLLFQLTHKNLAEAMQHLFMRYAIYFNQKYERKGHLFGGAYRQAICLDGSYLLASSIYIHLNPVKAGIVQHYSHYRWSTWRLYCRQINKPTFVDYEIILKMLDGDLHKARKLYSRKLKQATEIKTSGIYKNEQAVHQFREHLRTRFPDFFKSTSEETSEKYVTDEELEYLLSSLKAKKRLRTPSEKKARKFLIEQLLSRGFSKQEIAKKLSISRQALHKNLR